MQPLGLGAALVPFVTGRARAALMLALPAAGLADMWMLAPDASVTWAVGDLTLELVRVDRLSRLFGTIFHLAAFVNVIYSLHVRDTMQHLPVAARNPRIRMHPDDIEIVESALVIGEESRSWRLQPDPLITRGSCVVETDASRIDASVESRLSAIISKMFGGEREGDRAG